MPRRTRDVNPVDVIEAAYNLEVDDRQWLGDLAGIVRPLLDGGHGISAYYYDIREPIHVTHAKALVVDMNPAYIPAIREFGIDEPELSYYVHLHNEGLNGLVELGVRAGLGDVRKRTGIAKFFSVIGVNDFVALQTIEPGGRGVVFAAGQSEVRSFDARTRRAWTKVNAHIAAGRRLRAALSERAAPEEAILKPSGALEHAEGEGTAKTARASLREAVLRSEKARGTQRKRDPEAAIDAWTAMVSGRWSLVDRFERGGRRYVVARRNEHSLADPRALTTRERAIVHLAARGKSNKLIAYELGLSESTVGTHLSQSMRKLGVRTRVELVQMIMQLSAPPAS